MPKKKLKTQGRSNFQVDNKIREELLAKAQAEQEKEKKRIEKQALQRAEVEKLRKANLEEQATFIFCTKKKESAESIKSNEVDKVSHVREKSNNENSAEVLKDFDDDGIWDEDYGANTNYQIAQDKRAPASNIGHSSYQNCVANNKLSTKAPVKSSTNKVINGIDDIWDETFEENSSYQSSHKVSVNNTQHSSSPKQRNQQQWQTARPQKKEQNYRRNNNFQCEERSQYSNKEQRVNRFQNGRSRRESERSTFSNKSESWNSRNNSCKPVNTEADPVWDTPDWPTVGESIAAAPTVNVWEERKAKMESVQQMAPHTDREEEYMLQQAIQLSKRQVAEDEKKQRDIAKQFELQQKYLELNPDIFSEVQQHTNINSHDDLEVRRQARSSMEAVTPLAPSAVNGQNMSSYCNGARPKYASASNPSSSRQTSVLEDVWTNSEGEDVNDIKNTTEANKVDDTSPCEDIWGDYDQLPRSSKAEITCSRNADIIESSSLKTSQHAFESREIDMEEIEDEDKQSFYEISSEHEEISCQNISSHIPISLNEDFRQKFGGLSLQNAIAEKNEISGMFQNDEPTTNSRCYELKEEKNAIPGMTSNPYEDAIKNYPKSTEHTLDSFNSVRSNASLKSLAKHHDKTSIPFREHFEKADDEGKQHPAYFDRNRFANTTPPLQFDDNGNMMHAASGKAGSGTIEVNHAKNENLRISSIPCLPAMDNVKRWVESTNIDSGHASYNDPVDDGIESSSQLGNDYRSDAVLKSQHVEMTSAHSNLLNSMCPNSIKPPVQSENNFPINPVSDNQESNADAENPPNWNFMSLPNSTTSFNPPFITPNPAMAFGPTMVPIPNVSALTHFELQQMLLLSNPFFSRQFLLSQNYATQMYQQFAELQGIPNVAPARLIPPNSFGQMQAPTSLPHFSAPTSLPQFSAPTSLPHFLAPTSLPQFSAPTSLPQLSTPAVPFTSTAPNQPFVSMTPQNLPPNVPTNSFTASSQQQRLNPMQTNTPILPPGLYNNPHPPNTKVPEDLMRSLNRELLQKDTSVGIPPPRPASSRQPKQSASELCPLMQQASLRYNTERLLALENSNYQRAPFGNV